MQESCVRTDLGAPEQKKKKSREKVLTGAQPKTSGRKEAPYAVSYAEKKN
jgi:hypothetical protein